MKLSVGHKDLAGSHRSSGIIRAEGAKVIFPQISRQSAGSCPRRREKHHPVAFFFPAAKILNKDLKAVLIGIYIFSGDAVFVLYRHPGKTLIQSRHKHSFRKLYRRENGSRRKQKVCLSRKQISLFETMLHTLPELCLHSLRLFLQTLRLI